MIEAGGPVIQARAEGNRYSISIDTSGNIVTRWQTASRTALWFLIIFCWSLALGSLPLFILVPDAEWYYPIVVFVFVCLITGIIFLAFPKHVELSNNTAVLLIEINELWKWRLTSFPYLPSESSLRFVSYPGDEGGDLYGMILFNKKKVCTLFKGCSPNEIKADGRYLAEKMGIAFDE